MKGCNIEYFSDIFFQEYCSYTYISNFISKFFYGFDPHVLKHHSALHPITNISTRGKFRVYIKLNKILQTLFLFLHYFNNMVDKPMKYTYDTYNIPMCITKL